MKLIILEGTDRTGKDTVINKLVEEKRNVIKKHWSFPIGNTNEEKTKYQKKTFFDNFRLYWTLNNDKYYKNDMIMFWNRSHIGELVYGQLFRNSNPESWVWHLEQDFSFYKNNEIYLILLYADAEFVASKDDGNSYSAKIEDKQKEIDLFLNAYEKSSIINKMKIKVNKDNSYTDFNLIYNQIKSFINE